MMQVHGGERSLSIDRLMVPRDFLHLRHRKFSSFVSLVPASRVADKRSLLFWVVNARHLVSLSKEKEGAARGKWRICERSRPDSRSGFAAPNDSVHQRHTQSGGYDSDHLHHTDPEMK